MLYTKEKQKEFYINTYKELCNHLKCTEEFNKNYILPTNFKEQLLKEIKRLKYVINKMEKYFTKHNIKIV